MQETEFEIDRDAVWKYFVASFALQQTCPPAALLAFICSPFMFVSLVSGSFVAFLGLLFFLLVVFGLLIALVATFGVWLARQQANNLRYRLEGNTLRADSGVFFFSRQSIPLERITDINLVQGPVQRFFGIWAMRIQTAGSAQCEATLFGVREPESIRELILSKRKSINGEKSDDA
jgi:membrane protein YdbS with pleckstrin-like domain